MYRLYLLTGKRCGNSGSRTLKDAINEAMRDWVTNVQTTHYIIGSAIGPHPFPTIVRDFQVRLYATQMLCLPAAQLTTADYYSVEIEHHR